MVVRLRACIDCGIPLSVTANYGSTGMHEENPAILKALRWRVFLFFVHGFTGRRQAFYLLVIYLLAGTATVLSADLAGGM